MSHRRDPSSSPARSVADSATTTPRAAARASGPRGVGPRETELAPWQRMARGGGLLDASGRVRSTVFEEMTALAARTGAVNLGQGFPDFDPPRELVDAAHRALTEGHHQYAPIAGVSALRHAIVAHQRTHYGLELNPDLSVLVCAGATEALTAALLSVLQPGDEVVVFEPHYDLYGAVIDFAGATAVPVPLLPPTFAPDPDDVRRAFGPRTRAVLLNDPHNPTGTVASRQLREQLIELAHEYNAVLITDEVYEHLRFDDRHEPLASLPGAFERTLTASSAGKTFSATGWRVGWLTGPEHLVRGARAVKSYLSHSAPAPLQHAVAEALALPPQFFTQLREDYRERRDTVLDGLTSAGLHAPAPAGTFFAVAEVSAHYPLAAVADARGLAQHWAEHAGLVAIPVAAFASAAHRELYADWMRIAFCKRTDVLRYAMASLAAWV